MSYLFTFSEEVPSKQELKVLSEKGKENVKNGKTITYFRKYNQFKKDAITNLQYARETVFITGETTIEINEHTSMDKEKCKMYKEFSERFNKEKITDIKLFFNKEECKSYFDWSK